MSLRRNTQHQLLKEQILQAYDRKPRVVEFTYGVLEKNGIKYHAIAVVHWRDSYSRKRGFKIVIGRIMKLSEGKRGNCGLVETLN